MRNHFHVQKGFYLQNRTRKSNKSNYFSCMQMTTKEIFVFTPSTSKHAEQKALWKMFFNQTVKRHTELKEYINKASGRCKTDILTYNYIVPTEVIFHYKHYQVLTQSLNIYLNYLIQISLATNWICCLLYMYRYMKIAYTCI